MNVLGFEQAVYPVQQRRLAVAVIAIAAGAV